MYMYVYMFMYTDDLNYANETLSFKFMMYVCMYVCIKVYWMWLMYVLFKIAAYQLKHGAGNWNSQQARHQQGQADYNHRRQNRKQVYKK